MQAEGAAPRRHYQWEGPCKCRCCVFGCSLNSSCNLSESRIKTGSRESLGDDHDADCSTIRRRLSRMSEASSWREKHALLWRRPSTHNRNLSPNLIGYRQVTAETRDSALCGSPRRVPLARGSQARSSCTSTLPLNMHALRACIRLTKWINARTSVGHYMVPSQI